MGKRKRCLLISGMNKEEKMPVTIKAENKGTETIVKKGEYTDILKKRSSEKSYRGWIIGKIKEFTQRGNVLVSDLEARAIFKACLDKYNQYHPERKAIIELSRFKGISNLKFDVFPDKIEVRTWRKVENPNGTIENKEMKHVVLKQHLIFVLKAFERLSLGKRCKTREFAEIWARENGIWVNVEGKRIFDEKGFNYSNISGCRATFFMMYYPLKCLEYFGAIRYEKSGYITKLKDKIEIQEIVRDNRHTE